jgi:hypothetical protein
METEILAALSTGMLALHATEDGQLILLRRAPGLHVMETELPAPHSTKVLALHATKIDARPALLIGVLGPRAMETGTLLIKAPIDLSKATASSTMMCQWRYHTRALQANGSMVSTPL